MCTSIDNRSIRMGWVCISLLVFLGGGFPTTGLGADNGMELAPKPPLTDSLSQQIDNFHSPAKKADFLLELTERFCYSDPDLASYLVEWTLDLSERSKRKLQIAKAFFWKAQMMIRKSPATEQLAECRNLADYSKNIFEEKKEKYWLSRVLNLQARVQYELENYDTAAIINLNALKILEKSKKEDLKYLMLMGEIFQTRASINWMRNHLPPDSTFLLYDRSYSIYDAVGDHVGKAGVLCSEALLRADNTSEDLYERAVTLYRAYGSRNDVAKVYLRHALFCRDKFQQSREKKWITKSNDLLTKAQNLESEYNSLISHRIGLNAHLQLATEEGNDPALVQRAIKFYELALKQAIEQNSASFLSQMSRDIGKICSKTPLGGKDCTYFLDQISAAYDKILAARQIRIEEVQNDIYRYERAQLKRRNTNLINGAIYIIGGVIAVFSLLSWWQKIQRLRREQEVKIEIQEADLKAQDAEIKAQQADLKAQEAEIKAKEATIKAQEAQLETKEAKLRAFKERLSALRAQIEPHFISNTLNAIDSLVNQNRVDEASSYIVKFSRLSRMILESSKSETISLDEEITILKNLIALEKLRLGEMLTYSIEVEEGLNLESIEIPPMILQPFIENAIWHGIQKKEAPGKLEIVIRKQGEKELEFIVRDDGIGRTRAKLMQKKSLLNQKSWGMSITQERIETIPKMQGARLDIIDLMDRQGKPAGTEVRIRLPICYAEPQLY